MPLKNAKKAYQTAKRYLASRDAEDALVTDGAAKRAGEQLSGRRRQIDKAIRDAGG